MKTHFVLILTVLSSILIGTGCAILPGGSEFEFQNFNLSTEFIFVEKIDGLPYYAGGGASPPNPGQKEHRLIRASAWSPGSVPIPDRMKIVWQEGGVRHEMEFSRQEYGLPARLSNRAMRFSYLGNDKWRIKVVGIGSYEEVNE